MRAGEQQKVHFFCGEKFPMGNLLARCNLAFMRVSATSQKAVKLALFCRSRSGARGAGGSFAALHGNNAQTRA